MADGSGWWRGFAFAMLLALAACGGGNGADRVEIAARPALPAADYLTQADQFARLQGAALAADYEAFARDLHASEPGAVVAELDGAFGGGPFDLYTLAAVTGGRDHRRAVELRGPTDRLYLYLELDRAEGGWNATRYELTRSREAVTRRL